LYPVDVGGGGGSDDELKFGCELVSHEIYTLWGFYTALNGSGHRPVVGLVNTVMNFQVP
jgi:hypothetical protein